MKRKQLTIEEIKKIFNSKNENDLDGSQLISSIIAHDVACWYNDNRCCVLGLDDSHFRTVAGVYIMDTYDTIGVVRLGFEIVISDEFHKTMNIPCTGLFSFYKLAGVIYAKVMINPNLDEDMIYEFPVALESNAVSVDLKINFKYKPKSSEKDVLKLCMFPEIVRLEVDTKPVMGGETSWNEHFKRYCNNIKYLINRSGYAFSVNNVDIHWDLNCKDDILIVTVDMVKYEEPKIYRPVLEEDFC